MAQYYCHQLGICGIFFFCYCCGLKSSYTTPGTRLGRLCFLLEFHGAPCGQVVIPCFTERETFETPAPGTCPRLKAEQESWCGNPGFPGFWPQRSSGTPSLPVIAGLGEREALGASELLLSVRSVGSSQAPSPGRNVVGFLEPHAVVQSEDRKYEADTSAQGSRRTQPHPARWHSGWLAFRTMPRPECVLEEPGTRPWSGFS